MKTIAQRNEEGVVTMTGDDGRVVSAQIPQTRSMLGMIATNGLINGGVYKEDGWVYWKGQPVRKWHTTFEGIRVWEPRLKDLATLYRIYKQTQAANDAQWSRLAEVLHQIWERGPRKHNEVIAHAIPHHNFDWNLPSRPWWAFKIHKDLLDTKGLSFSFDWVDEKPKKVINHKLGQKLYELERRWWDTTCKRASKARTVFYQAMKRSLPKATVNKVISLQFGEDTFWFYTMNKGPKVCWWEMFDDQYQFEIKRIV